MSRDTDAMLKTLMANIQTLIHLLEKVDDGEMPMDVVTEQSQKIIDLLPMKPDADSFPILDLLMCRPLTRIELPSGVLIKLIASGFGSVNTDYNNSGTYFYHAVTNKHYRAVRILVQHGVVLEGCLNTEYQWGGREGWPRVRECAIVHLASEGNAPLDIFDLIATPQNLNHATPNGMSLYSLPLHSAVRQGHVDIAMRLIRVGADVDIPDVCLLPERLSLEYYIKRAGDHHDDLFTHLIPSQPLNIMNCFKTLARNCNERGWSNVRQPIIKRLMQYTKPIVMKSIRCIVSDDGDCVVVFLEQATYHVHIDYMYLFFIVVLNLQSRCTLEELYLDSRWSLDEATNRNVHGGHIDCLWSAHKSTVISLQDLCIQYTRASMRDLSDESFSSLPVPPRFCRQLKLEDRADIVCAAYAYFLRKKSAFFLSCLGIY